VYGAVDDPERGDDLDDVLHHLREVRLRIDGHQALAVEDVFGAVERELDVLPDAHALVHAVARHRVDHVLVAGKELHEQHLAVGAAQDVDSALKRLECLAHLLFRLAHGHSLRAGAVARLHDGHERAGDVQRRTLGHEELVDLLERLGELAPRRAGPPCAPPSTGGTCCGASPTCSGRPRHGA